MLKKMHLWRGLACIGAALLLISYTAGVSLESNRNVVDGFLKTQSTKIVTEGDEELWTTYVADYDTTDELVAKHEEMGERLSEEGSVLLKNNGTLPLSGSVKKVTLLGLRADAKTNYGATIGLSVNEEQNVSLTEALKEAGIEVNETVNSIYQTIGASDDYKNANKLSPSFSGVLEGQEPVYTIKEPGVSELKAADSSFAESIKNYNDAAIVVIGRPGSEAADYYAGSTGVDTESGARNALALSDDERDLISFAKENFDDVIILVNAVNTMELGELEEDDDIDAILWIGFPGNYGMSGVVDILTGEVSPSGALTDIYASDSTSSPAMVNFGVYSFSNAAEYLDTSVDRGDSYLIEAEGIYTGYRYYETRYADLVMGQGNADSTIGTFDSTGSWNYGEEVVYPFGYGLSYTTFEKTLDDIEVDADSKKIKATITVTNTGSVSSRTSVQLYAQAPYIKGGVEKSAVVLLDYAKSSELEPKESETITIETDLEMLTSYDDSEDVQSYILDAGEYYFTVADGSHEAINNILYLQGYTQEDGIDSDNNEGSALSWTAEYTAFNVTNKLSDADYNYWEEGTVTYLSRSDWDGTWPKSYEGLALTEDMLPYLTNDFYEIENTGSGDVIFNADNDLTFSNLKGLDYDDPLWDDLLDQLDLQEAINFITMSNRTAQAMESVGFTGGQYTENGPGGFNATLSAYSNSDSPWYVSSTDENAEFTSNDIGSAPLLAATFNKDFAYEYGVLWGNDSLFNGLSVIWAPGLNLHRTPYNGRNVEYYSEDPVLSGITGTKLIQGGLSKGLVMAPKHYAFNDQESNRNGVAAFMNEQKARELELRSFQIAFEGGTLGVMTSFNRIGVTYVGASEGLMDILYDEWGFRGYVVSDMVNPGTYMTWKESVIAGTTNFDAKEFDDSWSSYITATSNSISKDGTLTAAIKERIHNSLYAFSQSNMMNGINSTSKQVSINTWWRILYKGLFTIAAIITMIGIAGYVTGIVNSRKEAGK